MADQNHPLFNNPVVAYAHHRILLDEDGKPYDYEFLDINPAFEQMTKLKSTQIIGKTASQVFKEAKEDFSNLISNFGSIALNGGEQEFEQYSKENDRWYHVNVYSVEKMTFTTVFTDITISKETNDLLSESQAKYEELADSITDIYFAMDENLIYTYWNKASEQFTGISAANAIGKSLTEVFADTPELGIAKEVYLEVIKTKQSKSIINEFHLKDQIIYYEINAYPSKKGVSVFVKDVSQRIQFEKQLIEERRLTQNYLDTANVIIVTLNMNGCITMINQYGLELLGYSDNELIGKNWFEIILTQSDKTQTVYAVFKKIISGELVPVKYFENEVICKNGERRFIAWSNNILHDSNLEIIGTISSGIDITEKKRIEKEQQETAQRLLYANKATNDVIWDWNIETDTQQWNEVGTKVFGWTEIVEHPDSTSWWVERVHPDDRDRIHKSLFAVINDSKQNIWQNEYQFLKTDGSYASVVDKGYVIRDEYGKAIRMIGAMQDVTVHHQAINKIRESEKKYHDLSTLLRLLADNMPDMLWAKNLKKEYIFTNKAICDHLLNAIDTNEPIGKTDIFFALRERNAHPDNPEWHTFGEICRDSDSITLEEMKPMQFDEYGNIKGKYLYLDVHKAPLLDDEGKVIGVVGSARDVTAEKQAEEEKEKLQAQLVQAQKMESVGRLAGGVAHDFNNMLSVILGQTELALLNMDENDKLYNELEDIQKAAQRSADLTRQLLAFARKQTIQPKKVNLNDIVEDMLKMIKRLIGEEIELLWEPGEKLLPVWLDSTQMDQILANLCVNARDAISGIGKIVIKTENVKLDDHFCSVYKSVQPGDFVCLSVSDNGSGMDEETISHLFEPFFTTKEKDYGSGLGLATVYGIIKQNHGFIRVDSQLNQGTTFYLNLPSHTDDKTIKTEKNIKQELAYGQGTILIVEDEPAILRMTALMLSKLGYTVLKALSPNEAIRIASEQSDSIDLLLTDVIMPEMNGYDLVKEITGFFPDIKALFMSGYTADIISLHGVVEDGLYFIQKPFSITDLSAKIREILG